LDCIFFNLASSSVTHLYILCTWHLVHSICMCCGLNLCFYWN
jgi:hypothetical protein